MRRPAVEWNRTAGRVVCSGIFRATPNEIVRMCAKGVDEDQIKQHPTNPQGRGIKKWFEAQIAHYGLTTEIQKPKLMRKEFKKQIAAGMLEVAQSARALEQKHGVVEQGQADEETQDDEELMNNEDVERDEQSEDDEEPGEAQEARGAQADQKNQEHVFVHVKVNNTATQSDGTTVGPHSYSKLTPDRLVSSTTANGLKPLCSNLPNPLKRKADTQLSPELTKRSPIQSQFLSSRPWPAQQDVGSGPFLSVLKAPGITPSNKYPFLPPSLILPSFIPRHAGQHDEHAQSNSTIEPASRINSFAVPNDKILEDEEVVKLDLDRPVGRSNNTTEQTNSTGAREGDESEKGDDTADSVDFDQPSASAGPRATVLSRQAVVPSPFTMHPGPRQVSFYHTKKCGWTVACRSFAISENRGFLVYGHPKVNSSKWHQPLSRASRWADADHKMAFYYSQLLHRGLPATKSKEVAKWRLKSRTQVNKQAVAELDMIKTRLLSILAQNIRVLKAGYIQASPKVSFTVNKDAEVQDWMVEEPANVLDEKSAYGVVLQKWLYLRSKLPRPTCPEPLAARVAPEETALGGSRCRGCDQKYRLCTCNFCIRCGELEGDCACEKCDHCHLVTKDCTCEYCASCRRKYNVARKLYCCCFCQECGPKYSIEFLLSLRGNTGPVVIDNTSCKCQMPKINVRAVGGRREKAPEEFPQALVRVSLEDAVIGRLMIFIQEQIPEYFSDKMPPTPHRHLAVSDICGTYELVFASRQLTVAGRSELLISSDCKYLWGRFRTGEQFHGLLRTNRIPKRTSTEPVQCQVAIQHPDGVWQFDLLHDCECATNLEGLIFLGNGLVLLNSACFASGDTATLNAPIFGIKTSQECEDMDALRESWLAVHDSVCACTAITPQAAGDINPVLHSAWRPVTDEVEKSWNESYIDHQIDLLRLPTTDNVGPTAKA